jgi:hypothetical protein
MDTLAQMEVLLQAMKPNASKLYEQNVKAYAVQLRNQAQQLKVLAQQVRLQALEHHNSIAGRGKNKTVGGTPAPAAGAATPASGFVMDSEHDPALVETEEPVQPSIVQKQVRQKPVPGAGLPTPVRRGKKLPNAPNQ